MTLAIGAHTGAVSRPSAASIPSAVSMILPFDFQSASVVRAELREWLHAHGSDGDVVDSARLVATELVANAVRHANPIGPGVLHVRWRAQGENLALSVTDGKGTTQPERRGEDPTSSDGRGLAIVDSLTSRWWVETHPCRLTVHAILALS